MVPGVTFRFLRISDSEGLVEACALATGAGIAVAADLVAATGRVEPGAGTDAADPVPRDEAVEFLAADELAVPADAADGPAEDPRVGAEPRSVALC